MKRFISFCIVLLVTFMFILAKQMERPNNENSIFIEFVGISDKPFPSLVIKSSDDGVDCYHKPSLFISTLKLSAKDFYRLKVLLENRNYVVKKKKVTVYRIIISENKSNRELAILDKVESREFFSFLLKELRLILENGHYSGFEDFLQELYMIVVRLN